MVITYYGAFCFKVQSGDMILAFDPPSKKSVFKSPRFQANIVFVSQDQDDHNGSENMGQPFLISSPGEYEVGGVVARGVEMSGTVFALNLEGVNICHLGGMVEKELKSEARELLGEIDILFMPASAGLNKIIKQLEPKIIIPMYYKPKELSVFLEDLDEQKAEVLEKFSFKKKDLADKQEEVIVLKPTI